MQMQFNTEEAVAAALDPLTYFSRTSACTTLCHGNVKPGYTSARSQLPFSPFLPVPRRLRGFGWKCMTPHCNYVNGYSDRRYASLDNIDSFYDYGKGSCIRLQWAFLIEFFLDKKEISEECLIKYVNSGCSKCAEVSLLFGH